jgi:hypothetical protein
VEAFQIYEQRLIIRGQSWIQGGRARGWTIRGLLIAIGMAASACASVGSSAQDQVEDLQPTHAAVTPRGGIILPPEILAASTLTAYDAVLKLRPQFFTRDRTAGSGRPRLLPSVVLDRGIPESVEVLRLVRSDQVVQIRFIEPDDAVVLYGASYTAGVIIVRLGGVP